MPRQPLQHFESIDLDELAKGEEVFVDTADGKSHTISVSDETTGTLREDEALQLPHMQAPERVVDIRRRIKVGVLPKVGLYN